ncbi:MAG: hypothetical protein FJ319_04170 [SAR202 cluster bacterium]|nr:hypothetical protein [SAR202 cluster bacterium]
MSNIVKTGRIKWTGEHWIAYIRRPGEETNSGMVSLYHTAYSEVGNGDVAWVYIPGKNGFKAICTDNHVVARFALEELVKGANHPPVRT